MKVVQEKRVRPDGPLSILVAILVIFGLVMVYDASYPVALAYDKFNHDALFFFKRQFMSALLGVALLYGASKLPFWHWRKFATWLMLGSTSLLIIVFVLGKIALGAKRWISLGLFGIQPSEIAKLCLVVFLAAHLSNKERRATDPLSLTAILFMVAAPMILTERQPDMGTAVVMFVTFLVVLVTAGAKARHVAAIAGVSAAAAIALILLTPTKHTKSGTNVGGSNYRIARLTSFLSPEADKENKGYQNWRAMVGLGVGGWTGVGFTRSSEKRFGAMPERQTDFIFAVIGEEFGLLGTGLVVLGYLLLTLRGIHIATTCRDPFGRLLAAGLTTSISVQAFLNMGVVTSSLPNTGVPLPLISYGGSSLCMTLASLGILLAISRYPYYRHSQPTKTTGSRK
jgi:cell division protein FtsW